MNLPKPGSVLNATVAIVLRRGTCGRSQACWAYVSHTLPAWMERSTILQVNTSFCCPHELLECKASIFPSGREVSGHRFEKYILDALLPVK